MSQKDFKDKPFFLRRKEVMEITGWSADDMRALIEAGKLRRFYAHHSKKGKPMGYAKFYKEDVALLIGLKP